MAYWHQPIILAPLTLFVAQWLLQHGQDYRVVQDEVAEVAGSRCTKPGVADQGVLVQQAAGGGWPAGGRERPEDLHDTVGGGKDVKSFSLVKTALYCTCV